MAVYCDIPSAIAYIIRGGSRCHYQGRPRDPNQRAKLVVDMATGEVPNDKEQVLAALREQEQPTGRAKSAMARAVSQTADRRSEVARNAAAAR